MKQGKFNKASLILSDVTKRHPQILPAWLMLSSIYGQKGRFHDVVICANKIIALNPNQATAYSMLGSAYASLRRYDEAIVQLEKALSLDSNNSGILNNLGNALYANDKLEEAATMFRRALQLSPGYPLAHFGLGNCFLGLGKWYDAIANYKKAYQHMSNNCDINMRLAASLCNVGELDEAKQYYLQALKFAGKPDIPLYELARVCQLQGQLTQAIAYIEKSLQHNPENIEAQTEQVTILYKQGLVDKAHSKILELVNAGFITPGVVLAYGQLCHRFNECSKVISLAEALVEKDAISKYSLIDMHYILGKLYDKEGDYDNAFLNYKQANKILPGQFDLDVHSNAINGLVAAYTRETIVNMASSGCNDERPVFIVGMPRSGTSLVEQILASHPKVFGLGESNEINNIVNDLSHNKPYDYAQALQLVNQEKLAGLSKRYLNHAEKAACDAVRITDKMPANVFNLGLIMQIFPKARILHCKRDPRDTCLSIYFQHFSRGLSFSNDLVDIVNYYRSYAQIVKHWKNVLNIPIMDIEYTELVADLEGSIVEILDFIDLEWNENCLNFNQSDRITATASYDQARQPIYTSSLYRWKNYQKHIGALLAEFGDLEAPVNS